MTATFFGPRWDAPAVDDAVQVATPVGQVCYGCGEQIEDGDHGFLRGWLHLDGDKPPVPSVAPVHAECELRTFAGHEVGICGCTGCDTSRATAKLVWQRVSELRGRDLGVRDDTANPAVPDA